MYEHFIYKPSFHVFYAVVSFACLLMMMWTIEIIQQ